MAFESPLFCRRHVMSSLADLDKVIGFFSYSRQDDDDSAGALSKLRDKIFRELGMQLGHRDFRLWQDKTAIAYGDLWKNRIRTAIAESVFFIPIVTPRAVGSEYCKFEFKSFLAREAALGRANLVFPILYIDVPGLQKEAFRHDDDVLKIIHDRQYVDWRKLRHRDVTSTEVAEKVELFCENIVKALRQSWVQPLAPQKMAEPPRQAEPIVRVAEPEPQIKSERKDGARIEPPPKPLVQETAAVDDVTGAGSLPHDVAQQPSQGPGLTRISQTFKVHRGAES